MISWMSPSPWRCRKPSTPQNDHATDERSKEFVRCAADQRLCQATYECYMYARVSTPLRCAPSSLSLA